MKIQEFILNWHGTIPQKAMEDVIRLAENERAKTIDEFVNLLNIKGLGRTNGLVYKREIDEVAEQMKGERNE